MRRCRIVVADDNAAFLAEVISILETHFDIVAAATDGASALELVRQHLPDLVVLDIHMPGFSGIEVSSWLASMPDSPPVVICSVERDPEIMKAAHRAGAVAYVLKSRIQRDLLATVTSALQSRGCVPASHH